MSLTVTTQNAEYKVKFHYIQQLSFNKIKHLDGDSTFVDTIDTECVIGTLDPIDAEQKRKFNPLFRGYAKLNPIDNFNKNRGRKIALSRALQHIARAERKAFWDAYFVMRNGKF